MTDRELETRSRVSRRAFMQVAGLGVAGAALGTSVVSTAQAQRWTREIDVLVVGSGGAALSAAVGALQNGSTVLVLEKGPVIGGTTAKSGGAFWVPNSPFMQEKGMADPKDDALRYMARRAQPHLYRANDPTLGLPQRAYDMLDAFYEHGPRVTLKLHETGAMKSLMAMSWDGEPTPDYFAHAPENKAPRGRTTNPQNAEGKSGYGADMVRQLSTFVTENGGEILAEHQVTRVVLDETGRAVGVEVETPDGPMTVRALKGVIFGSGGFTHNVEMRNNYLRVPVLGGCAVPTNQGDLVTIAIEAGAKLGNMNEAWLQQEVLEEVLEFSSVPSGTWFLGGDTQASWYLTRPSSPIGNH